MHRVSRVFFIIGGLLVTALIVAAVFGFGFWGMRGGYFGYMHPWMMPYYGRSYVSGGIPFVIWILLVLFLLGLVVAISRRRFPMYRGYWRGFSQPESAMEILKRRYAAGEIGKEEFEEKKKALA